MSVVEQNLPAQRVNPTLPRGVASDTLGIYIHLPFCRTKCNYCAFVSGSPRSEEEMDRYTEAIVTHLRQTSPFAQYCEISTVFLGGGTPSLMGADRLKRIFEALQGNYRIKRGAEVTLEANPESATLELFQALRPLGLNRVSMGAQSFSDAELQQIGRVHSADRTAKAVEEAREAGIDNVSLDLIFALPGQTVDRWQENVLCALACEPDHLSSYGLTYEEGTKMHRWLQEGKVTPVLEESYVEMYDFLQQTLAERGWRQYEISNWCRPGRECRHNLIYWNRDDYLAFGVSASGTFQGWRYAWKGDKDAYIRYFKSTESRDSDFLHLPILAERVELSTEEAASDAMIFGLRKAEGIDETTFCRRYGYTPSERWGLDIEKLIQKGWLEHRNTHLQLAPDAYLISNEVLQYFLE